jgi:uncharacterized protein YtpQ (UPF0354 family)
MGTGTFVVRAVACLKAAYPEPTGDEGMAIPESEHPVLKPWSDDLVVAYLVDQGDHFEYVQQRHLASLNVEPNLSDTSLQTASKGLHEMGLINLAHVASQKLRVANYGAIRAVFLDGHFEASLLLLDDLWNKTFAAEAPNGAVAAVPSRDVLAFCDAKSEQGLQELQALVDRVWAANGDHLLTRTLYQRVNDGWVARPAQAH